MKILEKIKKHKLLVLMIIITFIRHVIVCHMPIWGLTNQLYDDDMMFEMAKKIANGKWLGHYTCNTLVKGAFFPLLLAFFNKTGQSYISGMSLIYIGSCIYFCYCIKDVVKNKKLLVGVYILLLFNPVSYAAWTFQRVYRNGITLAQVLIIIGSLFALYKNRNEKISKILIYSIVTGLALGTFCQTREDGIWIMPYVVMVIIITGINVFLLYKKDKKQLFSRLIIVLLPLIILKGSVIATKTINYIGYGVFTCNEINDGYFGKVLQTIYSIKSEDDIQYVTATRSKINKLYEVSPTLNSIKEHLESSLNGWDVCDRNPGDLEVEDGWFWWALKAGVSNAGYYSSAKQADNFYKTVYTELNNAIDDGRLEVGMKMPAKLMSPWKARYFVEELYTMFDFGKYVLSYDTVETISATSQSEESSIFPIREYEIFTKSIAIYPLNNIPITFKGWMVMSQDYNYKIELWRDDEKLGDIEREPSDDLYMYFKSDYPEVTNTKNARFSYTANVSGGNEFTKFYLIIKDENNNEINRINLNESVQGQITGSYDFMWNFDMLQGTNENLYDYAYDYVKPYVDILNKIGDIYKIIGLPLALITILSYIIITLKILFNKKYRINIDTWLLMTGILCSWLVLIAGVSYNHITACNSKLYMYLSGAYPLSIAFEMIVVIYVLDNIKDTLLNFKKIKLLKGK